MVNKTILTYVLKGEWFSLTISWTGWITNEDEYHKAEVNCYDTNEK